MREIAHIRATMLERFALQQAGMKEPRMVSLAGRSGRLWTLVAYLILHRDRGIPAQELIDLLWPDGSGSNPASTLQNNASRARNAMATLGFSDTKGMIRYENWLLFGQNSSQYLVHYLSVCLALYLRHQGFHDFALVRRCRIFNAKLCQNTFDHLCDLLFGQILRCKFLINCQTCLCLLADIRTICRSQFQSLLRLLDLFLYNCVRLFLSQRRTLVDLRIFQCG